MIKINIMPKSISWNLGFNQPVYEIYLKDILKIKKKKVIWSSDLNEAIFVFSVFNYSTCETNAKSIVFSDYYTD